MYSEVSYKYVHWGRKQEAATRLKYKIVLRKQYPDIKIRERWQDNEGCARN